LNRPVVALVGRPNVGKSTFFNRLVGERLAIVDDTPGTTRDRLFGEAEWNGISFGVVDTGGIDPSVRGNEPLSIGSKEYISQIRSQAEIAIQEADAVLFLVDAMAGVTPADQEVAQFLRRSQTMKDGQLCPPLFLVVNKVDNENLRRDVVQFYELGLGDPFPISAIHGLETGDLLDALVASFPAEDEEEKEQGVKIAIVGKPNVGKSSLLNRLVGQERAIVSPIAGTTRDAIDTHLIFEDVPVTLIDTAGIRRRGRVEQGVEKYSVLRSMRAIERADVVLLVVDAGSGITAQDTHIAGFILDAWKSAVVVVNKWDSIKKDTYTMQQYSLHVREELNFMDYIPIVYISALTGQRVDQVLPMALRVQEERLARISTSQLNRVIQKAQDAHSTFNKSGQALRIYYANQVRSDPPTFMLHVNNPELVHFSYRRYLENAIRKEFEFVGTPIRLVFKARR